MKFRTDSKSHTKLLIMSVGMLILGLIFLNVLPLTPFRLILILVAMFGPMLFVFTIGRSMMGMVMINEQGVTSKSFGATNGTIRWEDMAEVGVGTIGDTRSPRYYLYFVTVPLTEQQRYMINRMKHNNNAIWMELDEKAIDLVEQYYEHGIHAMDLLLRM